VTVLGRIATLGALAEIGCWVLATLLWPGSWRYDISALYAAGAPRPWLVMAGEVSLGVALAALTLGLRDLLPRTDHRMIGCALLGAAALGAFVSGLARDSCEESVPACSGHASTTMADWAEAAGSLLLIFGIAGAALVLAATLPRPWSLYSAITGCAVLASLLLWQAVRYPWVGTAERALALALATWVAAVGRFVSTPRVSSSAETGASAPGLDRHGTGSVGPGDAGGSPTKPRRGET
jgi:hypothetical protein